MGLLEGAFANISFFQLAVAAAVAWKLWGYAVTYTENRRIKALGGHAAKRTSWYPYGLDMLYDVITSALNSEALDFWTRLFADYGNPNNPYTVEAGAGIRRVVLTAEPENIKAILATQFQDFGKGKQFNHDWHDFLGDSIFTTDGQEWHNARQLIRPQFVKDRLGDIKTFERHVSVLLPMLGNGQPVDVADLFFRYTLDAATDFLLGRSAESLERGDVHFAHAFNQVQRDQSIIARLGHFNYLMPRGNFRRNLKVVNDFVNPFIDDALRLSPDELEKRTKSDEGYTFLHAIAAYTRDRTMIRDQLVAILLAGRDTTACTLQWLFYELSRNPDIVKKLRREILETVGPTEPPTYDNLKGMKYLQHTMNESLRLYPVVPFNVRVALRDTTLPRGGGPNGDQPIGVLKDNPIGYSTLSMQRRRDLYPETSDSFPDPLTFVPERWDSWVPKSWHYVPFNGGPRICIGQQFALTEMAYTITRILQTFERIECRMPRPPKFKTDIVLQPDCKVDLAFFEPAGREKA